MHEALHDSLTGLPNRSLFLDRLRHSVARAQRSRRPGGGAVLRPGRLQDRQRQPRAPHRGPPAGLGCRAACGHPAADGHDRPRGWRRVRGPARGASRARRRRSRRAASAGFAQAAVRAAGARVLHQRQHRDRDRDRGGGDALAGRRPGDVPGQESRQGPVRDLRAQHAHRDRRAARPRGRPEGGDRARRAGARLPADLQPAKRGGGRRRGAGPLAAPHARPRAAGAVRAAGRGEWRDPRARPLGAADGMPPRGAVARQVPGPSGASGSASTSPEPSCASRAWWRRWRRRSPSPNSTLPA